MPSVVATHDLVHRDAKVLYVDNDPQVLVHGRALMASDRVGILAGDIFNPDRLLADPDVQAFLDWSEPIALLQTCTLQYYPGDAAQLMKTYVAALAPGSYTVISHLRDPQNPETTRLVRKIEEHFAASTAGDVLFRTFDEIRPMFPDQELIEPGLVICDNWLASPDQGQGWERDCIAAGVGLKP
jgi:hypothetical protein